MGRGRRARPRRHADRRRRAEPARRLGGSRQRSRDRVVRGFRLGGSGEPRGRHAGHPLPDRHRIHRADVRRRRPAPRPGPAEARRADPDLRPRVSQEAMARHATPADEPYRRPQIRWWRRGPALRLDVRTARRRVRGLCRERPAFPARDRLPRVELRLDRRECGRRGGGRGAVPDGRAEAGLRAARHARHRGRYRAPAGSGDLVLPPLRGRHALWPRSDARDQPVLLRGRRRVRLDAVRSGPLRDGRHWRQAAAAGHGAAAPVVAAAAVGQGHRLRPGLGPRDHRHRRHADGDGRP